MSEQKNESTPKAVWELQEEERRKQFTDNGIGEISINGAHTGGGVIKEIGIRDGKVYALLKPFIQNSRGDWTRQKEYPLVLDVKEAWREGEDLIVVEPATHTIVIFRVSMEYILCKHQRQKHETA